MNKILIASLLSTSFLFMGFKEKITNPHDYEVYEDFTYEQVLKEERTDSSERTFTYFEYNVTNTGDGYIGYLQAAPYRTYPVSRKRTSNYFVDSIDFLAPNASAVYCFEILNYQEVVEITLEAFGYTQIVTDVNHSSLTLLSKGTPGNYPSDYSYTFTVGISFFEEKGYRYVPFAVLGYEGESYTYYIENGYFETRCREQIDESQISVSVFVVKIESKEIDEGHEGHEGHDGFKMSLPGLMMIYIFTFCAALCIGCGIVPTVVFVVKKIKNRKTK